MTSTRILVVDDSIVVRKLITDLIQKEPDLEVAGVASSGSIALQKIAQVVPDVVVLDVEMPGMDGIETAGRIRRLWPTLPIIMCSTLTERGAETTLRALAAGASDYVAKPSTLGASGRVTDFASELLAKIRAFGIRSLVEAPIVLAPKVERPRVDREAVLAIAIGSSTGGPNALTTLFTSIPRTLSVPIFIAQHMPPMFTRMLAERLTASSGFDVREAAHGDIVEPGRAYVAPGNFHMVVVRAGVQLRIELNQAEPENSCRPAVDVLFRSIARVFGGGALAAVLTGMGQDGTRGAQQIALAGGEVVVQDAASCVVPSMPNSVLAAVDVGGVYPIERMGTELVSRLARRGAPRNLTMGANVVAR